MQASNIRSLLAALDARKAHPRHRIAARTDGLVVQVQKALQQLDALDTADISELLLRLTEWCSDRDFVVEFAYRGCFRHLQRIMLELRFEECAEVMSELAEIIIDQGFSIFQSRNILDDRVIERLQPLKYTFEIAGAPDMEVLVTSVPQQQESQYTVGYIMWSAAVILARMLCRNPQLVSGRRVLEVGAGLGLCGLVAARWANEVILSDYNPTILRHMEVNISLNRQEHGGVTVETAPISPNAKLRVRFLDWEQLGGPEEEQPSEMKVIVEDDPVGGPAIQALAMGDRFDTIIASDMVCQRNDAFGVVRTLLAFLAPGGTAHIVLPSPSNRYGVEAFPEALEEAGLKFTCEPVEDEALTRGIEEASYFRWNYFVVHR